MKRASSSLLLAAVVALAGLLASHLAARAQEAPGPGVDVTLLWTPTCPHCLKARAFLERLSKGEPSVRLRSLELAGDAANEAAFIAIARHFQIDPPAVPVVVVGDQAYVGYDDDDGTGAEIAGRVRACLAQGCADVAARIIAEGGGSQSPSAAPADAPPEIRPPSAARRPALPERIALPWVGWIETRSLSLPLLTILLGAIDGFNPCAMWVLVFLIGLLVGLRDPVRMWTFGAVFLVTSGAVYLVFMTAWLNLFLVLGSLVWIRRAVALFALAASAYYLRAFFQNPTGACPVTTPGERQSVMERLKAAVGEPSFLAAIAGIMVLAVSVNLIELLCSAGIPAVYTQVLALSELSPAGYAAHLALYILVFMLDDAVVFVTAMLTLQATGLAATYARVSHLIGAAVLALIGLALLLKPEWLAFA